MSEHQVDANATPSSRVPGRGRRLAPLAASAMAATLVVTGALAVPILVGGATDEDSTGAASLTAVRKVDVPTPRHLDGPIAYPQVPPIGGDHNTDWLACGRYDEPVPNENAVHDLEHGTVWITYRPDLAAEDVALLAESLPEEGIMSPYPNLPAPAVVTVWGVQLQLTGADDTRLAPFLAEYGDGGSAPESAASCDGGIGTPIEEPRPV
ncbi:MAG: DUF3105 domain-containing protein [Nocardioides sp.]